MSTGFVIERATVHDDAVEWLKQVGERNGTPMTDLQHLKEHCKDLQVGSFYYIDIKTRQPGQQNWAIEHDCLDQKDLPVAFWLVERSAGEFRLRDVWWQKRVREAVGASTPREPTAAGSNDPWHLLTDACVVVWN